jgi:hypothetical protein
VNRWAHRKVRKPTAPPSRPHRDIRRKIRETLDELEMEGAPEGKRWDVRPAPFGIDDVLVGLVPDEEEG